MATSLKVFVCSLSVLGLAACSSSSGGSGGGAAPGEATSKEEALARLSPQHRQAFEAWKASLVKACDASSVFGLGGQTALNDEFIDSHVLMEKSGGSSLFQDGKSFAILTNRGEPSGVSTSKSERSVQMNGKGYAIKAETSRTGGDCTVTLFGQKVHETNLSSVFVVGAEWHEGKQAKASSAKPEIRALGSKSEVDANGVSTLLNEAFAPSKEAAALIAKKLGISADQAERYFQTNVWFDAQRIVRIASDRSAVWTRQAQLIADGGFLGRIFDGTERNLPLEVRLGVPSFVIGGKSYPSAGTLAVLFNATLAPKSDRYEYSSHGVERALQISYESAEGLDCVDRHVVAYLPVRGESRVVRPNTFEVFSTCRLLSPTVEEAAYRSGTLKRLVPLLLENFVPSESGNFGGWDDVVAQLGREAIIAGKDVLGTLDPEGRTKVIPEFDRYVKALLAEASGKEAISKSRDSLIYLGKNWAFHGLVVRIDRIAKIVHAANIAIDPFASSTSQLLSWLGIHPEMGDLELDFALTIDAEYKEEALKARALARELLQLDFERYQFDQILQVRTPLATLRRTRLHFETIKAELGKWAHLGAVKASVVDASYYWLSTGKLKPDELGGFCAAIDNVAVPFEQSTKNLIHELKNSGLDNKEALDFARGISSEYKQMALAIRDESKALEFERWGENFMETVLQKRPTLEQVRLYRETTASAMAYTKRDKESAGDAPGSASNDWARKRVVENALEETWSNAEFTGLEQLVEIARFKAGCGGFRKGTSSLAECAGLDKFRKSKGMLLDPDKNGRFVKLARELAPVLAQFGDGEKSFQRSAIANEFFGPIWSSCDANKFEEKARALQSHAAAYARETDFLRKSDLERQIRESLRNCW